MQTFISALGEVFDGEINTTPKIRRQYSHDASIFELTPQAVLYPKSTADIRKLVQFVSLHKHDYPALSITPRGAGTDMSGGAISNSLLVDMTRHFTTIHSLQHNILHVDPGVYMRDIDVLTTAKQLMIGSVPASRALCTIGGMVGNNSGGERSLRHGNTEQSVRELTVVLADGKEHTIRPINRSELKVKMAEDSFEGDIYRRMYDLCEANYDDIKNAKPHVNKNSMGYSLWNVWDRHTGIFDLTRVITGSQGTLGIVTDIKIQTFHKPRHNGLLIAYVENASQLADIILLVMKHNPVTFEGFDDITFGLGIKYFKMFRKQLGIKEWTKQQAHLALQTTKLHGRMPNTVLMIEFDGETIQEIDTHIATLQHDLKTFKLKTTIEHDDYDSALFWQIRRASLSLLRNKIHDKYAAPFIDDLTVQPQHIPEFLPRLQKIIRKYKLPATVAGHFGDGNFHIIPLMSIESPKEQAKLEPVLREVIPLIQEYNGTLAGEHNDGMIRGPWLPAMFGDDIYQLFRETKEIFDPMNIFNPHKKTDAAWDYSMEHIRSTSSNGWIK
ncbi:hypothetical protein A2707_00910 [Candidatus Saccharibacteria bacterium RIFCSPHIGHO2_01_FULL_45_15]|nr:MAG: hypothetical protein A2707_00910 [Candidatus Saccharibacteria bacterium RIFCSPHIGHO2_01_FULL_45_15]OGL26932.1 MAG: hypothetical protein A3C39_02025 [Candidatus Saccharibacteria bacterium RIFCSPHIGHO2_02_FULL_46_12]OGL32285.1 MAG: hypothetical protein A3E76_02730 [Candidatus Saccharibacteria bacterium RIFCSPHIGHO2_12_FULL_44_22]